MTTPQVINVWVRGVQRRLDVHHRVRERAHAVQENLDNFLTTTRESARVAYALPPTNAV